MYPLIVLNPGLIGAGKTVMRTVAVSVAIAVRHGYRISGA